MKKLTVQKGNKIYEIQIDKHKYILGSNYNEKFEIIRSILRFHSNNKLSECFIENNGILDIKINDKSLKVKETLVFHVTKYYSIVDDSKLNAKSLMLKYLECILNDSCYTDTIQTINILFESLSQELADGSILGGTFTNMVPKQLLKIFTPYYCDDEIIKDEFDLTIDEIVIFQLKLIKFIMKSNLIVTHIIVIIEMDRLTMDVYNMIQELNGNILVLVFINEYSLINLPISQCMVCENLIVDLANDEQIYNNVCDNQFCLLSLSEGRDYMRKYLYEKQSKEAAFISRLIKK